MVVEGVVRGAFKGIGNGTAKKDCKRLVGLCLCLVFVEGKQYQRVLHEVRIVEQRGEPPTLPLGGERNSGVMAIVGHIRSDKCPLRELLFLQIVIESGKILDQT